MFEIFADSSRYRLVLFSIPKYFVRRNILSAEIQNMSNYHKTYVKTYFLLRPLNKKYVLT